MKKSLLALAVLAVATSATAATVYDKDGTSLKVVNNGFPHIRTSVH